MELSVQKTIIKIFELWKKSYISLFPFTLLSILFFNSSFFPGNYLLALLMIIPGLYCYNIILLKLSSIVQQTLTTNDIYFVALKRLPNMLLFFISLAILGTTLVGLMYLTLGLIAALLSVLVLLIFYSCLLFSYPMIVIDGLSPLVAIKKSYAFINKHVWYVTGIFLIASITQVIFFGIFAIVIGLNAGAILYNLLFTTFNLALIVVLLDNSKKTS
ncbi:MAG: hypothetical protein SFW07_02090 [Gammaproteobacteria bacterium]|nr:hypothetical protein [Gammaproteobacteria bacterium]